MHLGETLEPIRSEIEADDEVRETVLPLARAAVRLCSESIKMSHRGKFTDASNLLDKAHKTIVDAKQKMMKSEFVSRSRILDTAYQELTEAANLLSLLRDETITTPDSFQIPSRQYLTGLADTIGELRRASLEILRKDNIQQAETLLKYMETILDELTSFDYPNALIPELRRKCDVGRALVERTRGDVTTAVRQGKLIDELRGFEGRVKEE